MRVKVSKILKWLNEWEEEYIDVELLECFSYPKIYNIKQVISVFETLIQKGKKECSKSELSRKTGRSRVTIDEWVRTKVLVINESKINLEESYRNLKKLSLLHC